MLSFGYQPSEPIASSAIASQIDIAPTILAELEIPPPSTWAGHPLQRRSNRVVVHFPEETRIGLFDLRQAGRLYKYWTDIRSGEEVAYDLAEDPEESRNQLERVPRELLRDWRLRISAIAVPIAQ
jgi:arylsulfatase A-like enzyme